MSENINAIKEAKSLINQLRILCKRNNIPMFVTLCENQIFPSETNLDTLNDVDRIKISDPKYYTEFVSPYSSGVILQPDYIAECIKIINDFNSINKDEAVRVDDYHVNIPDAFKN